MLFDRLKEDVKNSLKGGLSERAGVLRLLLSELQNKEKEKSAKMKDATLSDEEVVAILQRESKKRKEVILLFKKGGRDDLVKKEDSELKIIDEYLPEQMPLADVSAHVEKLIGQGFKDFNLLIKEAMKELKGKVDGAKLTEIIKEKLK